MYRGMQRQRRSSSWLCGSLPATSLLARNRLTRTAAGRRFVLSGECVPGGGCGRAAFVVALTTFLGLANRLRVRVRRVSAR
jgi:hypothetical protein